MTFGQGEAVIDVKQGAGARHAQGTFHLTQPAEGVTLEMTEFGQLQTAQDWASFTGRARLRPTEPERSVTVVLDAGQLVVSAGDFNVTTGASR